MRILKLQAGGVALLAAMAAGAAAGAQAPVPAPVTRTAFPDLTTGQAVYENVCQGCHMPDGKGGVGAGAYPALADNPKLAAPAYPLMLVTQGMKAMPEFGSSLSDAQIAGVVEYVRTHFGNSFADPVPASEVTGFRPPPAQPGRAFTAG